MALYGIWQTYIEGTDGKPLSGASIEIRNEADNSLVNLYSTRTGTSKSNPFTSAASGYAFAYLAPGDYKITCTSDSLTATFRHVQIPGPIEYIKPTVYADLAAINAAIDTPTQGMMVYVISQGLAVYKSGWKKVEDTSVAIT